MDCASFVTINCLQVHLHDVKMSMERFWANKKV